MFDWQTEEEAWSEEPETPPTAEPNRPNGRTLLIILVVLGVAALIIYRQVSQQITQAVETTKQDVLASFRLVRSAALTGDMELFQSLLSGRDPQWTEAQTQLVSQGLLWNRESFRLLLENQEPTHMQVTLSPDLTEAVVTAEQVFTVQEGEGKEQVRLLQTAVFRQGAQQWLYAPPSADFWGQWRFFTGDLFNLTYPARDEEIILRLAADLKTELQEMCRVFPDLNCPHDLHISLRLERDPAVFFDLADPINTIEGSQYIVLPTPTLLGLPVDEAGYEALFRGYAEQVLSRVITDLVGWQCCGFHPPFYQALLYEQLNRLGIRPFPLTATHYETILNQDATLGSLNTIWADFSLLPPDDPDWVIAMAATQFMLSQTPDVSPVVMQQQLGTYENYWSWLERWLHNQGFRVSSKIARQQLERDWFRFIYEHSLSARSPSPISLPDQDIQLLCGVNTFQSADLYRYTLSTQTWTEDLSQRAFSSMAALPNNHQGILLEELVFTEGDWENRLIWWQNGQEIVLSQGYLKYTPVPDVNSFYVPQSGVVVETEPGASSPITQFINLNQCTENNCEVETMPVVPIWSPDGTKAISADGEFLYWELDAHETLVGPPPPFWGTSFFWLNNDFIGYMQYSAGSTPKLIVTDISDPDFPTRPLLTRTDLLATIPETVRPNRLIIQYLTASPTEEQTFFVAASNRDPITPMVYLFKVQWQETVNPPADTPPFLIHISLLLQAEDEFASHLPFQFSPNGRWLTMTTNGFRHPARTLYLYDLVSDELQVLPAPNTFLRYTWSADGEWLLRAEDSFLSLYAPAYHYRRLIFHDYGDCPLVAWVDR